MKKIIVFLDFVLIGLLVISLTSISLQGAIPPSERAALIAFYNATNGDNWVINTGWKGNNNESDGFSQIGSEGTWYGVTVTSVSGDHVTSISVNDNYLHGNIPAELGNLINLESLDLGENQLSGSIPAELGNLSNLKYLFLLYNQLIGSISPELGNLSNLTELNLRGNLLKGSIPSELGNLNNLELLELDRNDLSGSIPAELGNLSNLEWLNLGWNDLSGSIPAELGNLSNLTRLYLGSNQLSGSIPAELGNLSNLQYLWLDGNQLSGSIPPELGNLSNLKLLYLNMNKLSGSIPPELGNLINLTRLDLADNQLSGSIPSELGNLSNLQNLRLGANQLSGSIPAELGKLSNLENLYLYANQLSGNIPPELGNLSKLEWLILIGNQLTGNIPSSLINLTNLLVIYINYNGLYTNDDTLRTFLNSKDPDWEDTQTIAPSNVSAAAISNTSIRVFWTPITYIWDTGGYKIYYSTTSGGAGSWTYAGMTSYKSASFYDVTGLSSGTKYYFVIRTQTNPHSENYNTVVSEYSEEVSAATTGLLEEKDPPFGSFDTPSHGSTVASSIPVTGWALDDTGIYSVKIYRAQGNGLIYIGDATMVEGARPDVAQLYPEYPNNTRAGYGYMMLTNFLPNNGNGTFVIHAIATDLVGKTTTLGAKTIHCDNANAVKPFGAIDTPTQGGTASGSSFVNWGWVLTPQPNSIPTDGSTIHVYVDGVDLGHPTYNIYRSDIATFFPGYANSEGPIGCFYLDTTTYTNSVHTIQWTAADSGGNADGIGSRYFSIQNSQGTKSMAHGKGLASPGEIPNVSNIPIDDSLSVRVKKGFNRNVKPFEIYPDDNGIITVEIAELERIEVHLDDNSTQVEEKGLKNSKFIIQNSKFYSGYQVTGNQLMSLPIGSTIDTERGIFYWQPGPGFMGEYHFVFIEIGKNGKMSKKDMIVTIVPKFTNNDDTHTD